MPDPDFRKLWIGQAISQIGSNITGVGLPLTAVLVLKASPLQMGFLSGAGAGAVLLFGLFAGAWVDRLRRWPILIAADLGRAAVLGIIPLAAILHRLTIGDLYLVAVASGILTVLFDVAYQAYLPSLIARDNILTGNSRLALTESIRSASEACGRRSYRIIFWDVSIPRCTCSSTAFCRWARSRAAPSHRLRECGGP